MTKINIYSDGCAKPDGSSGIGWVIHNIETGLAHLFSQSVNVEGKNGQRSLAAEKHAAVAALGSLIKFPDICIIDNTSEIQFFNDNIAMVGELLRLMNCPPRSNSNAILYDFFNTASDLPQNILNVSHMKRNKNFMPIADYLAADGASGIVHENIIIPFKGFDLANYKIN